MGARYPDQDRNQREYRGNRLLTASCNASSICPAHHIAGDATGSISFRLCVQLHSCFGLAHANRRHFGGTCARRHLG